MLTFYYRFITAKLDGIPPSPPLLPAQYGVARFSSSVCIVRRLPRGLEQTTLDHPIGAVSIITPPRIGGFRNANAHPLARH